MTATADRLEAHRRPLWALAYRLTGDAAEADDVVQETFRRFVESPPGDLTRDLEPWLRRVATNLSVDALRRRRRRGYVGTWLPTPVPTAELLAAVASERLGPDAQHDALESLSLAMLHALERLGPRERAVVILRDVLGCPAVEVAALLGIGEGNVRVILHRARKRLGAAPPTRSPDEVRRALDSLLAALASGDLAEVERLLAADVVLENDADGRYHAAAKALHGARRVARFLRDVAELRRPLAARLGVESLNGVPSVVAVFEAAADPRIATEVALGVALDVDGRVGWIWSVLGAGKLARALAQPTTGGR